MSSGFLFKKFRLCFPQTHAEKIAAVDYEVASDITETQFESLKSLWADTGIQDCYERRREFQISDSAK